MRLKVCSLNKNFNFVYKLLSSVEFSPSSVALSESRLKNQFLTNISIPGYSFVHVDSESNGGGGAVYISNSIQFQLHKKQFHLLYCESIWLTVYNDKIKSIVGRIIYQHPSFLK